MSGLVLEIEDLSHLSDEDKDKVETLVKEVYERGYKDGHRKGLVENLLNTELEHEDD